MARICGYSSHQLLPHWHKASGSETQEKMLHSIEVMGGKAVCFTVRSVILFQEMQSE
jgi:hypothetical protein